METQKPATGKGHSKLKRRENESKLEVTQNNKGLKPR